MKKTTSLVKAFFADEKGAETVEWVMIAAVLAGIIITSLLGTLGTGVDGAITDITGNMTAATGTGG